MKIQQNNLRLKGSLPTSASKPKFKLSQITQGGNNQTTIQSVKKLRDLSSNSKLNAINSNYHSTLSNDRHVSFDTKSNGGGGHYNSNNYNSTAAATIAFNQPSKYGHQQSNGLAGLRSKSPIDAQVSSSAYNSIGNGLPNDENMYDNIPVKLNSLAEEYKQRQQRMDSRLKQEIENHSIATVSKQQPANFQSIKLGKINQMQPGQMSALRKKSTSPLHNNDNIVNSANNNYDNSSISGGMTSGSGSNSNNQKFYRSQRSVAMRIKDTYENQVNSLDGDKLQLIQKLNDSLLELDKLNQERAVLSNKLIEQSKFVRDMQRETQKGEDISGVVNDDLKVKLRTEKELSLQLKEDLKMAEQERIRILQRIHELSQLTHEGEIRHSDMNIDMTVKTRSYEDLQNELRQIIDDIARNEQQIDNLRAIILANEDTIRLLRDSIDKTVDDKRNLHLKITALQDKYDEAVQNYQKERLDTDIMQSRHIQLISSNILFDNLAEIHRNNMQYHFNMIKHKSQAHHNNIKGLILLRSLFKQNRKFRLKRFLNIWYTNALKPMKCKKQKQKIVVGMRYKNPMLFAYYKWQNAYEISQSKTHCMKKIIMKMLSAKEDYHKRAVKYMFTKWRDVIRVKEDDKKKIVKKFLMKKHRAYIGRYFSRWVEVSQELDNQIQLNGMAQKLAYKKYLSVLFSKWRLVTTDLKLSRQQILIRAIKNMKIYTLTRKQMRGQTWSILREQKKHTENLLKSCFDALRIHKEQEKYAKVTHELYEVEIPRRDHAQEMIARVQQDDSQRYKQQAVNALAKCFGKQLQGYFKRWQKYTEAKSQMINVDLKSRIQIVFLKYLRDAFTRWIEFKGHAMIQFQSDVIQSEQEQIQEAQIQIAQAKQELVDKKSRQQCQSSKQIKKIISTAYEKRLREHLLLWKANLDHKSFVQDKTEKVLMKLNRRQKLEAFNRYLAKIKEFKLEQNHNTKVDDMRFKLTEKTKKKVFNSIKQFSQDYIRAKNYMRRLLTRLEISLKETTFKKWQKYENYKTVKALQSAQNDRVQVIQELQKTIQEKSDSLEDQNQINKKLKKTLENNGRRVIRLAFQRCIDNSQDYLFQRWKQYVRFENDKRRQLNSKIIHLFRGTVQNAFRTWSKNIRNQMQIIYEEGIMSEEKQIQMIDQESKLITKHFSNDADQANAQLDKLKLNQNQLMQKHQNCLRALINKVDNQDYVSKQRYILQNWHQFVQNRKKCINLIDKAIKKTLWQQGLKAIKEVAKQNSIISEKQDKTSSLILKYSKIKLRYAFSQWRDECKVRVIEFKEYLIKETNILVKKQTQLTTLVKNRIQEQLSDNCKHLKQFNTFIAWRNYIKNKILLRKKVQTYHQQVDQRDKLRTIDKWVKRQQITIKFRHVRQKLDRVYNKNLLITVFNAWSNFNYLNKGMVNSIQSMSTILNRIYAKRVFQQIKLQSEVNKYQTQRSKARSVQLLAEKLQNMLIKRQSQVLNDLRVGNVKHKSLYMGQKAVIKYYILRKIRDYFLAWKEESERKEVVRYMNEEGPVAIQNHTLKKLLYNLKLKAMEDGFKRKQVEQVIIDDRKKSVRFIEKSVCRLFCYNEEMYLLPKCLDQWKKWVQMRKLYKYWLNQLNNRADVKKSGIFWAFQKWKYVDIERYNQLNKKTKGELSTICFQNNNKMQDLVNNMELADATVDELTEQRDLLLKRYVGSQRLALSAINANTEKAKQKVLSRWIDNNSSENQGVYEDALKENLRRIQAFKDKIKYLEKSNNDLADQNEDLRQGALDGIEMAKQIDDLNRDREKLSVDLADKAITIRKLLEDNNNLSIRLGNAQEEAQNLIKISQIKLEKSSSYYNHDDY